MARSLDGENRFQPLVTYEGEPDDDNEQHSPAAPEAGPDYGSAFVSARQALETTTGASLLPSSPHAQQPGDAIISPARPSTTRNADALDTPSDRAREQEVSDERRERRRVSIETFDENEWPPLQRGRQLEKPKNAKAKGSLKQIKSIEEFRSRRASADASIIAPARPDTTTEREMRPLSERPPPPPPPVFHAMQGTRRSSTHSRPRQSLISTQEVNYCLNIGKGEKILVEGTQDHITDDPFAPSPGANDPAQGEPTGGVNQANSTSLAPRPPRRSEGADTRANSPAWRRAAATAIGISARVASQRRSNAPSPADHAMAGGHLDPRETRRMDDMDVDDAFADPSNHFTGEVPAAQPQRAYYVEDDDELEYVDAGDAEEPSLQDSQSLHPAFELRTVLVASNGDNDPMDGMVQDGHLAHMLPSQRQAWESYAGNKAICICDDLDGLDPSTMNRTAAVKKLARQLQGAWPGSAPEVSIAEQDPSTNQRVRKNTFLVKNIDDEQLDAFTHRRHYIIGAAKLTTFTFNVAVSPFLGTVPEICMDGAQVKEAILARWPQEQNVTAVFDKFLRHKQPSVALRTAFFKSLRVVPMATKAQGEHVVEFNIYADAPYLPPALHKELRDAVKAIRIVDGFAGVIALRDPDWKCTACPSRGHPRGLCKTHDVPGWHATPAPASLASPVGPGRGGTAPRGNFGSRGARGGRGRGRGF